MNDVLLQTKDDWIYNNYQVCFRSGVILISNIQFISFRLPTKCTTSTSNPLAQRNNRNICTEYGAIQ